MNTFSNNAKLGNRVGDRTRALFVAQWHAKHAARNNLLLVCVFLSSEGVGAVRTCQPPGIAATNMFRSLYFYMVDAAPSFCIRISFNDVSETGMKKTALLFL